MIETINRAKVFFLDLIFPEFCVGCSKEEKWLCESCQEKILMVKTQVCPLCGRISKYGAYCLKDRDIKEIKYIKQKRTEVKIRRALGGIIVAAYYEEGPIKEMIHNFKYNNITEIGVMLGEFMTKALKENIDNIGEEVVV